MRRYSELPNSGLGDTISNMSQIKHWTAQLEKADVPDGDYPVMCVLEMEPPIEDPRYVKSTKLVTVKDG
jgi:hypothetical protein